MDENVNNKFIALFLGDDTTDFAEVFGSFSDEEQNVFIELMADMNAVIMKMMVNASREEKTQLIAQAVKQLSLEVRGMMSDTLIEFIESRES